MVEAKERPAIEDMARLLTKFPWTIGMEEVGGSTVSGTEYFPAASPSPSALSGSPFSSASGEKIY